MGLISLIQSCFIGKTRKAEASNSNPSTIYDISIGTLDGKGKINFSDFKGKYIVVVNTASECGYTPQYKDLQDFYVKYKDSNIVLIACPCNQFGGQEPGTAEEISKFCSTNYSITFPMSEKIDVKGDAQHPLYSWLCKKELNGSGDFEVKWNFNKFVVGPDGKLLWYFASNVKPSSPEFLNSLGLHQ